MANKGEKVLPLVAYVKNENCNSHSTNIYLVSRARPLLKIGEWLVGERNSPGKFRLANIIPLESSMVF